jgi:pyridoxamine 5'-phosphate oxidase
MSPLDRVAAWVEEARAKGVLEPDAMALATARDGAPSVRFVLCRGIDATGIRFFTSYESRKAGELENNPRAAVVFHWAALGKQVRIEGTVSRLAAAESDAYFAGRPRGSQLAASVSPQSRVIASLEELRGKQAALAAELGDRPVPRPASWGGYRLTASRVELWTSGADRMHERLVYERAGEGWKESKLAP